MITTKPFISVIMSVYNTLPEYLAEAIESILKQSYTNFEFLIVDDCCQAETKKQLEKYRKTDNRIQIIHNQKNIGLTKSLNIMLNVAKGKYIARMDADDISKPDRLQKQMEYMETHLQYAVIGCRFEFQGKRGISPSFWNDDMAIRRIHLLFYNDGICHPTAFFRNSFLKEHHIEYDQSIKKSQDYAMWLSIADEGGIIGLCPEVLFSYRIHPGQISSAEFANQMFFEQMTIRKQLDRFSPDFCEIDRQLFYHLYRGEVDREEERLLNFLKQLIAINMNKNIYSTGLFVAEIKKIWKIAAIKQVKKKHRFTMMLMIPSVDQITSR